MTKGDFDRIATTLGQVVALVDGLRKVENVPQGVLDVLLSAQEGCVSARAKLQGLAVEAERDTIREQIQALEQQLKALDLDRDAMAVAVAEIGKA